MESRTPDASVPFVDKWLQREPEMQFAEVFCPPGERPRFRAWGALLHELRESLFELSDPGVARVKTGWWAEETIGLGQGRQRHPLGEALIGSDAPWSALGRALLEFDPEPPRSANTAESIAALEPLALATTRVESALFGGVQAEAAARSLAVHWLLQRLPQGLASEDQARLPMHLLARHGLTADQLPTERSEPLLRDWAGELLASLPSRLAGAALIRRSRLRFDQARQQALASGRGLAPPAAPATLWRAWRAARDA
jgi:hypothetical protein